MDQERADFAENGPTRRLPSLLTLALIGISIAVVLVAMLGCLFSIALSTPGPRD